ncbi:hypothetical protein EV363DRAFT_1164307 [Boletus edulis]|nr:hypothetical protein EV363DRAFT_1164307 [Boletus edulis]
MIRWRQLLILALLIVLCGGTPCFTARYSDSPCHTRQTARNLPQPTGRPVSTCRAPSHGCRDSQISSEAWSDCMQEAQSTKLSVSNGPGATSVGSSIRSNSNETQIRISSPADSDYA